MSRLLLIGVGPGDPQQVTLQAVAALRSVAAVVVTEKGSGDPLAEARRVLLARHAPGVTMITVEDAERDRSPGGTETLADYRGAVGDWHAARAAKYAEAVAHVDGDVGFLVWGDPALYDSTIRVLDRVAADTGADLVVIPGISSLQALAAAHRIVLHEIGQPIHVTTGRRLAEAIAQKQENIAVMLNRDLAPLAELDGDWLIWWGANLGTPSQELVAGTVAQEIDSIREARTRAKESAGWVMDAYLVRRPSLSKV